MFDQLRHRLVAFVRHVVVEHPIAWAALGFGTLAYYAQFIRHVSWNAIELIIAQHLIEHGQFVTSLDYPSAITWRPVLPTLVVTFLRLFTDDPMIIYRIFCGVAIATLSASLFAAGRRLGGLVTAHLAAALALFCPAITTYLADHPHSYSHWGGVLTLGPAIWLTIRLLMPSPGASPRAGDYAGSGVMWGVAYLSRSELLLFAGTAFLALVWWQWASRREWRPLAAWLLPFALIFGAYNVQAELAARRDGLLIRKTVYTYYMSQGWVDPAPWGGADIERDGYRYALQLYGDPLSNEESLFRTIRRNPEAFFRRVRLNVAAFYRSFAQPGFFSSWLLGAAAAAVMFSFTRHVSKQQRLIVLWLASLFAATHAFLVFHIDPRYVTIAVPALLLLAALAASGVINYARGMGRASATLLIGGVVLLLAWTAWPQINTLRHHRPRNDHSLTAMREFGEHFRAEVRRPRLRGYREPHIHLDFPEPNPLQPEDAFLLGYFTRSAWVVAGAEGIFPRGRFYSYRDVPPNYRYVPEAGLSAAKASGRVIATHDNSVLGRYYLLEVY